MVKVAYVDHSYHQKTISTKFIPELLEAKGCQVDYFWDDSWRGGKAVNFSDIKHYDVILMFQSFCNMQGAEFFKDLHPNVTYIPMLDQFGIWSGPLFNTYPFWKPFQGIKILNFSTAVHGMVVGMGMYSKLFRFYREPKVLSNNLQGLHGFLWVRREEQISWPTVKLLIGDAQFDSFHLHLATDPGSLNATLPSVEDIKKYNITVSNWFEKKSDFEAVLEKSNVFFTPRMEEGIGQSFLEAFARGQCVVAPNNGTMNEYIQDGLTGLLYDWQAPTALDFSRVPLIQERAYEACQLGYQKWLESHEGLVNFLLTPQDLFYQNKYDFFADYKSDDSVQHKAGIVTRIKARLRHIPFVYRTYHLIKQVIK